MPYRTVNIESGMPTVQEARSRLNQALYAAKASRESVLKVIHGYGSSGTGGAIKQDVQRFLMEKKRAGMVKEFVSGENFSPFDEKARRMVTQCPDLSKDRDYSRSNHGITVVLL